MIKKKEDARILLFCYIPSIISLHYTPAYDIFFYPSLATITPIIYSMGLLAYRAWVLSPFATLHLNQQQTDNNPAQLAQTIHYTRKESVPCSKMQTL